MSNYSIGLSGLDAAQKALSIVGNNIANSATEGYHRQRTELAPAYSVQSGPLSLGQGVEVTSITRLIDNLLEQEILRQQSSLGHISQEVTTLQTIENAFGEFSVAGGLNEVIDNFFNALQDLSAHPSESIWQNQAVTTAEAMTAQFRTLGEFLTTLEDQIKLEADHIIEQVNLLLDEIAKLNDNIKKIEILGNQANNLRDRRDLCISELSELISVQTVQQDYGVVNVIAGGMNAVTDSFASDLEISLQPDGSLGITVAGTDNYKTSLDGGQLGGLFSLKNQFLSDIRSQMDALAGAIIQQVNQYHVQGVGSSGSFTQLTGWTMSSENLADFDPPVTDGSIFIRVINTSTGEVTRSEVTIDAANDSLTDIATAISAITGLTASVVSSKLSISADANYKFDFLPAVLPPEPDTPDISFNGSSDPTVAVSGIYAGSSNDTLRFTVSGTGDIGNGTLTLVVTDNDGAGDTIATVNIGSGYAAGEEINIGDTGIRIALSTGDLVDGDYFKVDVFADTDTSDVLAAVGINTFFSGTDVTDIAVCSDIAASPARIATALGADMTDNTNVLRLAALKDQPLSSLNAMTPGEFYSQLITDIGQQVSIKQMRRGNIEVIVQNLADQQSIRSGVDVNDEAARLLVFEQMFQAMAKYLNLVNDTLSSLMEIL
jgi:flagellar hook-associated protein 1 FlgK